MRYLVMLLVIRFVIIGCSTSTENGDKIITKEAVLIWSGAQAVDGCGFFIEIENKIYKPENEDIIPNEFENYSITSILITFEYLNKEIEYDCGFSHLKTEGIVIVALRKIE